MKKNMITTMAAVAALSISGVANATPGYQGNQPSNEVSLEVGDIASGNTITDTKTENKMDDSYNDNSKTVGDVASNNSETVTATRTENKMEDSYNDNSETVGDIASGNTKTVTVTDTKTETESKVEDSYNDNSKTVGDIASGNTRTVEVTKTIDSYNSKIEDSYNSTTVDVTKNIAKADDASVSAAAGGDATVTATVTSLTVDKEAMGAIVGGNVNVAYLEADQQIDEVTMGGVQTSAGSLAGQAGGRECCDRRGSQADGAGSATAGAAYGMYNAMTGNVADGIGINSGNVYQVTNAPSANAVNGNYNISSVRGEMPAAQ